MNKTIHISKHYLILTFFGLYFLASCFTNKIISDQIFTFAALDNYMGSALQFHHIIAFMFLPLILIDGKVSLPNIWLCVFLLWKAIITLAAVHRFGFSGLFLNAIIGFYIIIAILSLGKYISNKQYSTLLSIIGIFMLVSINIKLLFNINTVTQFIANPFNRPAIMSFFGGGTNIEATWVGILCVFLINRRFGFFYLINCVFISILYASRAGLIVNALCLLWYLFQINKKHALRVLSVFVCTVSAFIYFYYTNDFVSHAVNRFMGIGNVQGTLGRIQMWEYVWQAFKNNPLGYGHGNAVSAVSLFSGFVYSENNVHNLYMQVLLDLGVIGICLYIGMIVSFFYREMKTRFNNPFAAALGIYFVVGMVQFRGVEPQMAFLLGIYFCTRNNITNREGLRFFPQIESLDNKMLNPDKECH